MQAHDEKDECNIGDLVRIHSCRPLSKRKSFIVTEVIQRSRLLDVGEVQSSKKQETSGNSFAASAIATPRSTTEETTT